MKKREDFAEYLKVKIDEWNEDIDYLEKKVSKADEKTKQKYNEIIITLKEKKEIAKNKFDNFEDVTEGAWDEIKDGFEQSINGIGKAYNKAKSYFKD